MEMEKREASDEKSKPWQSYHTVYTNAKAGMDGVDKEKVQRIVYEMSKGSKYFENEERKEALMKQKIENMKLQYSKLIELEISHYQMLANKRILELEATRDLTRIWLHVDMDAFYAAVETLSNPSLKGKPMAVGSMSMISTANYEARKFGVRAAMPGFIACKLCPELVIVPTDFKKYTYYSDLTRKVFQKYDPKFMAASLDEAYLDITEICKERNISSGEIADELRSGVYEETGLTCSAGVGPNRLLAKVCSDINKPNGQFVIPNDRTAIITFISSLPIRKIGGIGKVTECILRDVFGIKTCAEMLENAGFLSALFSQSSSDFFLSVGLGLGGTDTPQVRSRKSISNERTFQATDDESLLYQKLEELADKLSTDMGNEALQGRTLTLKLKTASFEVRTRAVTLQKCIHSAGDILNHALKLLKAEFPVSVRLMGLRMSHFEEEKVGDPAQKTIADFIVASGRSMSNDSSISTDRDLLELPCEEREMHCDGFNNNDSGASSPKLSTKMTKPDRIVQNSNSSPCEVPQLKECDLFRHSEDKRVAERDEKPSSCCSVGDNRLCWVNGYKCSICGIELPPSFVEERQEHSDFHFAEQLQREESCSNSTIAMPRRRSMQRETNNRSKKLKPSSKEVKHVPIDMYFSKSN